MNNELDIFDTLAQEAQQNNFVPLVSSQPQNFDSYNAEIDNEKDIFDYLVEDKPNQAFSFLETAKDIAQQIGAKGTQGLLGSYGNFAEALGLGTKEVLPGQEARLKASFDNELESPFDDDLIPNYNRLPTSKDVGGVIEKAIGVAEGKTPAGRIAGRGAEFIGEGLALPGGGAKAAISLGLSGIAGQGIRESGGSESLATGVEIAGSLAPSAIQGKVVPRKESAKQLAEGARKLGLTERQITPLVQGERKVSTLSKIARKGEKTKQQFSSIQEALGDSYHQIKQNVSHMGQIDPLNKKKLTLSFEEIKKDLTKTLKGSPDKEAALNFINEALINLKEVGATPEQLINFWQDINKSVKWNSIQGGKKALTKLKEPILDVLYNVAPEAAKDFETTNKLYTKYAQVAKKLKPDIIDSFANKAEIMGVFPAGVALVQGNPWYLSSLGGEFATRILAREMLTNPYFQNIATKLVENFNQGSAKGVKDLVSNVKIFMENKYPEEKWDFLVDKN
jgi:hypothetical protein